MPVTARSISDIFNEWAKNLNPSQESIDHYGFKLRVVASIDIPPRHSIFSFIRGMGINKFDEIFSGELNRLPDHYTPGAVFVKLCDRIANVQYSKLTKSRMFETYKAENHLFGLALGLEGQTQHPYYAMYAMLLELFESPNDGFKN